MQQFEHLRAAQLYCQKCGGPREVRERLLLVLPDKEIYDYLCTGCASSLGTREVSAGEAQMAQAALRRRRQAVARRSPRASAPPLRLAARSQRNHS